MRLEDNATGGNWEIKWGTKNPPGGRSAIKHRQKATFRVTHCNGKERGPAVLRLDDDGTGGNWELKGGKAGGRSAIKHRKTATFRVTHCNGKERRPRERGREKADVTCYMGGPKEFLTRLLPPECHS